MPTIDTGDLSMRELLIKVATRQDQIREDIRDVRREVEKASDRHASKVDLERIEKNVSDLAEKIDGLAKQYVTQAEFGPVKRIVYGAVGIILVAVIGAVIGLVVVG